MSVHRTVLVLLVLVAAAAAQAPVAKVLADDTSLIGFGQAVARDGDTAVAFGTLPDHEGRAVVLARRPAGWVVSAHLPFLPVGHAYAGLQYGENVELVGDTCFVGATGDPDGSDNWGLVHVYERDDRGTPTPFDDVWIDIDRLYGGDLGSHFGFAVAADAERVVVGGPGSVIDRGWARVFTRDDSGTPADPFDDDWATSIELQQPGAPSQSLFGFAVALSGDLVAVSDPFGDGRVHTWLRVGGGWLPNGTLTPTSSDPREFGFSLALDGDTLLVGHRGDGLQGSASVFRFDDGGTPLDPADDAWLPEATLTHLWTWADFGWAVALEGDRALVSTVTLSFPFEAGGRVVEYARSGGAWTEQRVLSAPDEVLADRFGASLALQGGEAVVGARGDTDVDAGSGAVWLLDLDAPDPWVDEGFAKPGPEQLPRLVGWGLPADGHVVANKLLDAYVGDTAWLVLGPSTALLSFKGGTLVPEPLLVLGPLTPSAQGRMLIPWTWPVGAPSGARLVLQCWLRQAFGGSWSATNGLSITMP